MVRVKSSSCGRREVGRPEGQCDAAACWCIREEPRSRRRNSRTRWEAQEVVLVFLVFACLTGGCWPGETEAGGPTFAWA